MAIKFLYIDDEVENKLLPLAEAVSDDELSITIKHPSLYNENFGALIRDWDNYDGFIIDWRLDMIVLEGSKSLYSYRGGTITQELRSRIAEKEIEDKPIVLWSTEEILNVSLGSGTAQDLFDLKFYKEDIAEYPEVVNSELKSIVRGYSIIDIPINAKKLLEADEINLDIRLINELEKMKTSHKVTQLVLKNLIERPGLLIDENRLAAKMGIDIEESTDWNELLALLPSESKYSGPFSDGWPRWWKKGIDNWWRSLDSKNRSLSSMKAEDRVEKIKMLLNLEKIVPAKPLLPYYQSTFTTICEFTKKPLDPIDGVIIDEPEPEPWQDRRYISIEVALRRESDFRPHPTEYKRLQEIKSKGK